ncbi:uncharacterized protein LOC122042985 [Zingiber officinale]|uniref:PGG domain-containing protein n=1 Tax=Zingiber officinale TaxID=94328 RepID=A0A8J5HS52_ZINOF|nr:uncharacterized protein LOC122042985 [Zingiber officinale]KAG6530093.1 hypothetical protein ZIOFF_012314 [Zingiber officinale]
MSKPQAVDIEMNELRNGTPATEPPHEQQQQQQQQKQQEQRHFAGWERNDSNVLLVVATLITALTYQMGTNLPGGYYQDDSDGHQAGDSILRDKHRLRYWLFMAASWAGFGNSMLMTLALLTGVRVESRLIRWPFAVAYSSLVLAFIASQPKTHLLLDILLWVLVLFILWAAISFKRCEVSDRASPGSLKDFVRRLFGR